MTRPNSSAVNSGWMTVPPSKLKPLSAGQLMVCGAPPASQIIAGTPTISPMPALMVGKGRPVASWRFLAQRFTKTVTAMPASRPRPIPLMDRIGHRHRESRGRDY